MRHHSFGIFFLVVLGHRTQKTMDLSTETVSNHHELDINNEIINAFWSGIRSWSNGMLPLKALGGREHTLGWVSVNVLILLLVDLHLNISRLTSQMLTTAKSLEGTSEKIFLRELFLPEGALAIAFSRQFVCFQNPHQNLSIQDHKWMNMQCLLSVKPVLAWRIFPYYSMCSGKDFLGIPYGDDSGIAIMWVKHESAYLIWHDAQVPLCCGIVLLWLEYRLGLFKHNIVYRLHSRGYMLYTIGLLSLIISAARTVAHSWECKQI